MTMMKIIALQCASTMEMILLGKSKRQGDEIAGHWATKEVPFYSRKEVIYTRREVIYPRNEVISCGAQREGIIS